MSQPVRLEFPRRFYQREVEAITSLWCPAVLKSLPTVPERGALNSTATHIRRGARQSERTLGFGAFRRVASAFGRHEFNQAGARSKRHDYWAVCSTGVVATRV